MAAVGGAGGASQTADCIRAIQSYINKILKPRDKTKEISGMKCLLLDRETKGIVSMVYSMNDILTKEVFLVETLDSKHESMGHLKAIVLLRPTTENIKSLVTHLREPKFLEYHIFFTNIVPQDLLRKLADADHLAVVKGVHEYYADFYAVNPDVFSLNLGGTLSLAKPKEAYSTAEEMNLKRCTSGLLSLLLALKIKPYVRYLASSEAASSVAREIAGTMGGERELFSFQRAGASPLVLIMDRREDPITPLLTQWTYQAMVHELLPGGIKNNRVDLRHAKGVSKDLEEVVLSPVDDAFYKENLYSNFGDLGAAVQGMLEQYTAAHKMHETISSIEDMQRFVDKYPELKSKGLTVGKHVALMTELAGAVESKRLLQLSEIEQNVACSENPNDQFRDIQMMLSEGPVDPFDALRLVMLYALRYERSKPEKVAELKRLVSDSCDMKGSLDLVDALLSYAGASQRSGDLFGTGGGVLGKLGAHVKRGLAGVDNVLTQHQPLLTNVLDQLARGKLSRGTFPFVGAEPPQGKFSTVIVFYVGGVTYEEAAKVAQINNGQLPIGGGPGGPGAGAGGVSPTTPAAPPFRVLLGGTAVHNAKSFLAELQRLGGVSIDMGGDHGGYVHGAAVSGGGAGAGVGF